MPTRVFPNRKHTPDTLRDELNSATSQAEMADLSLLIMNAERRKGAPKLDGVAPAANRQAQRRHNRERTRDQNSAHNPTRRIPVPGDYVRLPDGKVWLVSAIRGESVVGPGEFHHCPIKMVTIVDGPAPAPSPAPAPDNGRFEACEALYKSVWDALEVHSWEALETALRAYEARLAGLGA